MADENQKSRADEIFDMLNENGSTDDIELTFDDTTPPKQESVPENKTDSAYIDELLGILSDDSEPESVADTEGCPINCDEEIPDSIFSHLSDAQSDRTIPDGAEPESHFTDQSDAEPTPEPNPNPDTEDDEAPEKNSKLKKAGRVFQRLSLIPKAIIYMIIVVAVALLLAYYIITIGNDVFALVTGSGEITITIPEDATDKDVAKILEDEGIIEYGFVYELYMKYRGDGDESTEYIAGEHTLNLNYNYSQIITALTSNIKERTVERITIPEGFTVDEIIDLLIEKGIGSREGYIEAINEYPYKWEFVKMLDENGYPEARKYRLEGYLYPDTYEFFTDTSEVQVINRMLSAFNDKFWLDYTRKNSEGISQRDELIEKYGMDYDDIIILASMIQSEGKTVDDFYGISFVFHNRLSHAETYPYLQSDATLQYVFDERIQDPAELRNELETNESPYNSYKHKGLPPGAISNPGLDALSAAMYPSKPLSSSGKEINAYYFVSNNAGKTYFASGESGHNNNKAQVEKDNIAIEEGTYEG